LKLRPQALHSEVIVMLRGTPFQQMAEAAFFAHAVP
jgi:hypothetical protein